MKATITDSATLAAVRPIDLLGYVRTHGWRQAELTATASLWDAEDGEELLVPAHSGFADYAHRIADALRGLAHHEGRSQLEILRDIVTSGYDLVRVRAIDPDFADGSMPIDSAVGLMERSRDLLLAAACAAHDLRPVFHTRKPVEATDYMQRVRMGQTEVGSFIVTLQAPVPPALQQALPGVDATEPYERRVTETLNRAVAAVVAAARASAVSGNFAPFKDAVRAGVTANLCDAIVGLQGANRAQQVAVGVSWASIRPAPALPTEPLVLTADAMPLIQEASRLFREQQPDPDAVIVGHVVQLNRNEGALLGDATVQANFRGRFVRVKIADLGTSDYEVVTVAHDQRLPVRVIGEVRKQANRWVLRGARGIALEDVEPESQDG